MALPKRPEPLVRGLNFGRGLPSHVLIFFSNLYERRDEDFQDLKYFHCITILTPIKSLNPWPRGCEFHKLDRWFNNHAFSFFSYWSTQTFGQSKQTISKLFLRDYFIVFLLRQRIFIWQKVLYFFKRTTFAKCWLVCCKFPPMFHFCYIWTAVRLLILL